MATDEHAEIRRICDERDDLLDIVHGLSADRDRLAAAQARSAVIEARARAVVDAYDPEDGFCCSADCHTTVTALAEALEGGGDV